MPPKILSQFAAIGHAMRAEPMNLLWEAEAASCQYDDSFYGSPAQDAQRKRKKIKLYRLIATWLEIMNCKNFSLAFSGKTVRMSISGVEYAHSCVLADR